MDVRKSSSKFKPSGSVKERFRLVYIVSFVKRLLMYQIVVILHMMILSIVWFAGCIVEHIHGCHLVSLLCSCGCPVLQRPGINQCTISLEADLSICYIPVV